MIPKHRMLIVRPDGVTFPFTAALAAANPNWAVKEVAVESAPPALVDVSPEPGPVVHGPGPVEVEDVFDPETEPGPQEDCVARDAERIRSAPDKAALKSLGAELFGMEPDARKGLEKQKKELLALLGVEE